MLLVQGGTIVDATRTFAGDVLIDGERIVAVETSIDPTGHDVIDASGALVIPGAIDPHTHFDLPVGTSVSADDFATGTLAAAWGDDVRDRLRRRGTRAGRPGPPGLAREGRGARRHRLWVPPDDDRRARRPRRGRGAVPVVRAPGRHQREAVPRVPRAVDRRPGHARARPRGR